MLRSRLEEETPERLPFLSCGSYLHVAIAANGWPSLLPGKGSIFLFTVPASLAIKIMPSTVPHLPQQLQGSQLKSPLT